ncbi:Hypothetical predicted protein [Lynx pardinus]|uniref:Uncharacterized protein n=1 Tax=Lynx pardinus TaxID=191816 RepID=A0A485PFI1_LYNPA|nr:Hypothetical predicted protein [Lynx pardinus]
MADKDNQRIRETDNDLQETETHAQKFVCGYSQGDHECAQTSTPSMQMRYERNSKHNVEDLQILDLNDV